MRTCIACQEKRAKRELIRVVRTPEGAIEIDPKGKRPGRGTYLCPRQTCWDSALDERKLSRALKCQVSKQDVAELRASAAPLLRDEPVSKPEGHLGASEPKTELIDKDLSKRGSK